ncbi:MAG: beta-lactamase family protein [Gemmatimonadetes bacterium]|nr:beta-lactamase family protein [Gemmatimonadota bacterium]
MPSRPILIALVLAASGLEGQARPTATRTRAEAPADRWQSVRDTIHAQLLRSGGAAVSVAVAKDGKIVWEEGFGWANREKRVPATEHTAFSLASISKPITATGLMILVERGQVSLDRPANEYLGLGKIQGLAGDAAGATVRKVLGHTAGLPLHYRFFYQDDGTRPATMDETIARYGNLVSAPGETFRYSNLGYGIIDHIVARTAGRSYRDFMRTEVFLPLGMTRTSVDIAPGLEPFVAERYDRRGRPIPFYTFDHNGGSAVYSSAHDLVRFGMFHLKNRLPEQRAILTEATIDLMRQLEAPRAFGAAGYSLGWVVHENQLGYRVIEHTGGMPGVNTALNLFPTENLVVTVLTNGGGGASRMAEEIAAVVLPRYGDSLRVARARQMAPTPTPFTVPAELAGTWRGTLKTWEHSVPLEMAFEADGDVKVTLGPTTPPPGAPATLRTLLNGAAWRSGVLTGTFLGTIPTPDASPIDHQIGLELRLVGGKLRGQAAALSTTDPIYFALASYVELTRQ